jgi:tetratricopeptide (TPR) repeat protein
MAENIFIGRKNELDILYDAYKEAENGKGKLVLVEGSAGIGKTGLVREFLQQIEKNPEVNSGVSECNDKENLNSYAPFKDILLELNAQSGEQKGTLKKDEKLKKLKQFVTEAGTSWIGLIPVVGGFATTGIDTYKAYKKTYDAKPGADIESENDIYRIFENEFRRLAKENTIVVFIDDLQWADASSLNLIFALGKTIRANPFKILLIGSYRHNEIKAGRNKISENGDTVNVRHPFADKLNELRNYCKKENHISGNDNWFQEIAIKPLLQSEMKELINIRFPNNEFSPDFFDSIENITDRHPLFIVEILDYLQRNGIIVQNNGGFSAQKIKLDDLPVSVNAIINEKVERLDKELKKVLSYASVNGEEFSVQVVEKILKIDELDLLDYLEELSQKHGLLVAGDPIQVKDILLELYSFSQTLVHRFIYDNMDAARRRALHRRIADTIKLLYGDDIENNKEIKDKYNLHKQIGQGLIDGISLQMNKSEPSQSNETIPQAENFIVAAITEIQNAKESYEQYAMNECYEHVDKALAFLTNVEDGNADKQIQKFEGLLWRNKARQWQGHYQKALETANAMADIAKQLSNDEKMAQANLCIAKASTLLGNGEQVLTLLEQAIEYYKTSNKTAQLWEAYNQSGQTKKALAAYDDAISAHEKAIKLADDLSDEKKKADSLLELGSCLSNKAEYDKAIEYFNQAFTIFENHHDQFNLGHVYNKIGLALLNKAAYDESLVYLEKALKIAQNQNDQVNQSSRINNIALVYESKGDYDAAIGNYKKSLAIDQHLDDKPMIVLSLGNIGTAYADKGDIETAMKYLNQALGIAGSLNDKVGLSALFSSFGSVCINAEDNEKAIEYLLKSLEIDNELGDKVAAAIHSNNIGIAYNNLGNTDLAIQYYQKAAKLYTDVNDRYSSAIVNNNIGGIAFANQENEKAIEYYEKAMEFYNEVDDKLNQSLTGGNLAKCYNRLGQYEEAIPLFKKYIEIAESVNEKKHLSYHYGGLGLALYEASRYEEAIAIYEKSIPINEALNKQSSLAENYQNTGYAFQELGNYNDAIINLTKSCEIYINLNGKENDSVAECYFYIGNCFYNQEQYASAISNHQNALEIQIALLGEDHLNLVVYYSNLGLDYYWNQQYDFAVKFLKKAFDLSNHPFAQNFGDIDRLRFNLGKACYFDDREEEANECFSISLTYRKNNFGEDSPEYKEVKDFVANTSGDTNGSEIVGNEPPGSSQIKEEVDIEEVKKNIDFQIEAGDEYFENNNYEVSTTNYQEAIKTILEYFGEGYELVADLYRKSARNFLIEKQYESSVKNYTEAIRIYLDLDEDMDEMIAQCYRFLAYSYVDLKRYEEALSFYNAALNLYVKTLGDDCQEATDIKGSLESLHNLINSLSVSAGNESDTEQRTEAIDIEFVNNEIKTCLTNGDSSAKEYKYEEAYSYYLRGYERCDILPECDEKDKTKGYLLFKLGLTSKDLKKYEDAERNLISAISILEKIHGRDYLDTTRSYSHLGDVYYFLKDYENAIKNHEVALQSYINLYGNEQSLVAWSHYDLGVDYYHTKEYESSVKHFKSSLEIRLKLYGEEHDDVAGSYFRIALSSYWNKDYEVAILNYLKALKIRTNLFGSESREVDNIRFALGKAYFYADLKGEAEKYFEASRNFRKEHYGKESDNYKRVVEWIDGI